jgi:hypothetical protein
MNWKFDFSPETSDIVAVDERCYCWRREYNQIKGARGFWQVRRAVREARAKPELIAQESSLGVFQSCSLYVSRLKLHLEHHSQSRLDHYSS